MIWFIDKKAPAVQKELFKRLTIFCLIDVILTKLNPYPDEIQA